MCQNCKVCDIVDAAKEIDETVEADRLMQSWDISDEELEKIIEDCEQAKIIHEPVVQFVDDGFAQRRFYNR